jgi:hypothetical protein
VQDHPGGHAGAGGAQAAGVPHSACEARGGGALRQGHAAAHHAGGSVCSREAKEGRREETGRCGRTNGLVRTVQQRDQELEGATCLLCTASATQQLSVAITSSTVP